LQSRNNYTKGPAGGKRAEHLRPAGAATEGSKRQRLLARPPSVTERGRDSTVKSMAGSGAILGTHPGKPHLTE
jgi:hypothetical protein